MLSNMLEPQTHSFILTFVFVVDILFMHVRGDDPSPVQETEMKYAGIGIGVGIFLSVCFIAVKVYMIKRHLLDNEQSEDSMRACMRSVEVESRT
ncbi:transmembrane protein 273 isoform X2 [Tachysurus fulvidraco]|uniref:transmembrane protein 273 isoform X2 n=1 Tax=Tachysurus fulvidraco TaxID=1234273 RepID=UPI000F4ECF65|nr:transmembrane protein 273 isoform X2 [Tachysurus fulvidraco]